MILNPLEVAGPAHPAPQDWPGMRSIVRPTCQAGQATQRTRPATWVRAGSRVRDPLSRSERLGDKSKQATEPIGQRVRTVSNGVVSPYRTAKVS